MSTREPIRSSLADYRKGDRVVVDRYHQANYVRMLARELGMQVSQCKQATGGWELRVTGQGRGPTRLRF